MSIRRIAGHDLSLAPQLLGVLGSALCELLLAEGEAVLQQADLSHLVSQVVDVLALGLNAPLLGDADQLISVLDLIVAALAGPAAMEQKSNRISFFIFRMIMSVCSYDRASDSAECVHTARRTGHTPRSRCPIVSCPREVSS